MLETLVPSKVRRAVLAYLLAHPGERFYLRGLAKDLGLSVSPLRRELKRMEQAGLLVCSQEANILFYRANAASPAYHELQRLGTEGAAARLEPVSAAVPGTGMSVGVLTDEALAVTPPLESTGAGVRAALTRPLRGFGLVLAALLGLGGMLAVVDRAMHSMTHQRLSAVAKDALREHHPGAATAASGAMRGQRWQVVPGGFGGFAAGGQGGTQ